MRSKGQYSLKKLKMIISDREWRDIRINPGHVFELILRGPVYLRTQGIVHAASLSFLSVILILNSVLSYLFESHYCLLFAHHINSKQGRDI